MTYVARRTTLAKRAPRTKRTWIASDLRKEIDDGTITPGDRVSVTHEAHKRGAARQTVGKALQVLEKEGLVRFYPGYGYVVEDRPPAGPPHPEEPT